MPLWDEMHADEIAEARSEETRLPRCACGHAAWGWCFGTCCGRRLRGGWTGWLPWAVWALDEPQMTEPGRERALSQGAGD